MALNRQQAIIWTNADPVHWCIYAAPGVEEWMYESLYSFADDILKCIFNENVCGFFQILLKFVPKSPVDNMLPLVQVMALNTVKSLI